MRGFLIISASLALFSAGCSSIMSSMMGSAGSSAGSAAGNQVGSAAGNRAGAAAVDSMGGPGVQPTPVNLGYGGGMGSPQATTFYTQFIFGMAFGSGGYAVAPVEYKAGQYTRWNVASSAGSNATLERAFLSVDADGNQWWKVKFIADKGDTTILEALFSPKDQKMLRLRAKYPHDAEGKEMPVSENSYYAAPQRLTQQSIDGATVGTASVVVPAGQFKAKHVVFADVAMSHEWWLMPAIPGGVVKQLSHPNQDNHKGYEMDLVAYGNDAHSELNSK
jgi:hypothetical protein